MSNKIIEIENCSECPYKIWNENHKTSECGGSFSSSVEGPVMGLERKHINLKEQYGNRI